MTKRSPLYRKNQKLYCTGCGEHLFTMSTDVFLGDAVREAIFLQNEGQGPWKYGQARNCRKCDKSWFNGFMLKCRTEAEQNAGRLTKKEGSMEKVKVFKKENQGAE